LAFFQVSTGGSEFNSILLVRRLPRNWTSFSGLILENNHYPVGQANRALSRFCGGGLPHVEVFDFWVVLAPHLLKAGFGITIPE
jgi:hypothetical protein